MALSLVDDPGKQALRAAVEAVEARSSAEVVVAIRGASGFYLHADLIVAAIFATATLAFLLFSHVEFAIEWFVVDPLAVGAAFGWLSSRTPWARRLLTPARTRRRWVETAAHAAFFERGVHMTSGRTGVLVYVSNLERQVALIGDRGVTALVPPAHWADLHRALEARVDRGLDVVGLAQAIGGLAPLLEPYLPRAEDDVNELPDEVDL
ncbi:MAG: hypothetical protein R3B09_12695 [Nannocystaceae bacterium]